MAGRLNPEQQAIWTKLLEREQAAKVETKRDKPTKEQIEQVRQVRQDKRDFLATLPQNVRNELTASSSSASRDGKGDDNDKHEKELQGLREFQIAENPLGLVDIGANLQSRFSYAKIVMLLRRAYAANVRRIILTGCSLESSQQGIELCKKFYENNPDVPGIGLYATVGVHPHDAKTIVKGDEIDHDALKKVREMASSPFCVSLGECGLDYDRMFSPMEAQKLAFQAQVQLACELQRPLFVHLRERDSGKGDPLGAFDHCAEILQAHSDRLPPERVCVHCFTGDSKDLQQLVSAGYFIGLTGFIGMSKRASENGTLDAINDPGSIPIQRLMIETDSPFMKPDKSWFTPETGLKKSKNNEPSALPAVCRAISAHYANGTFSPAALAEHTTTNAIKFFGLSEADEKIKKHPSLANQTNR